MQSESAAIAMYMSVSQHLFASSNTGEWLPGDVVRHRKWTAPSGGEGTQI